MGNFKLIKKLMKIQKECDKNPELEERLNKVVPLNKKQSDLTVADVHKLLDEYERIKEEMNN